MDCQGLASTPDQLPSTWLWPLEESVEVRLLVSPSEEDEVQLSLRLCSRRPRRDSGDPVSTQ